MLSKKSAIILMSSFVLLFTSGQPAFAAKKVAPCKGLASAACEKNAQCSWVKAYKRKKDGKKVGAFCRSKPSKKIANKK